MSKRDVVKDTYARNLHRHHERRAAGLPVAQGTPWEDLDQNYRDEYLQVAGHVQDALERYPEDPDLAVLHLVELYKMDRYGQRAVDYWTNRIAEALGRA